MDKQYNEIFSRNIGIITASDQEKLLKSTIAIAGVGSVGGLLAERLIRMGVGRLKITDPGDFKKSNFNRQFGASMSSLGHNKAEEVFHQIKDINSQVKIDVDPTGITSETDAIRFVGDSDLVVDGMDFGMFSQSIWLQKTARQHGKYYLFAYPVAFGAMVVIFSPKGMTLEEYDNLPSNVDLTNIKEIKVPLERVLPIIPSYAPVTTYKVLKEIYTDDRPLPSLSIGVGLASILATNEIINIILQKRDVAVAPRYTYIDLLDRLFVVGKVS
jgi:molybdopterin/thiamine biosynthesis adenylyltransferase